MEKTLFEKILKNIYSCLFIINQFLQPCYWPNFAKLTYFLYFESNNPIGWEGDETGANNFQKFFDIDENGSKFEKSCLKLSQIASLGLFWSKITKNHSKIEFWELKVGILAHFRSSKSHFLTIFPDFWPK